MYTSTNCNLGVKFVDYSSQSIDRHEYAIDTEAALWILEIISYYLKSTQEIEIRLFTH